MKKMLRYVVAFAMVLAFAVPMAIPAMAASVDVGMNYAAGAGLGERDPREIAASIINIMLGFLGILAVVIILIGGFKWMTAAGNEDQVGEAKKIIVAGIIGLVIILASWGIASFVLSNLLNATNNV
jgi:heme/copper-type cytochrome/quinol oxidase subunit 2